MANGWAECKGNFATFDELLQLKAGNLWHLWDDLLLMQTQTQVIRGWRSLIERKIRSEAPEIGVALRFLPAGQRVAVQVVVAFCQLLISILEQEEETSVQRDPPSDHDGGPAFSEDQTEACPCSGSGGSLELQLGVGLNIIDFVFHEARPGEVGQAEIELFLAVQDRFDLSEEACRAFIRALADFLTRKRFATVRALHDALDQITLPLTNLLLPLVCASTAGRSLGTLPDELQASILALGRAIILTQQWPRLKSSWIDRGQLLVPLDLIATQGWRDTDFMNFMQQTDGQTNVIGSGIRADFACLIAENFSESAVACSSLKPTATARALLLFTLHWKAQHDLWPRTEIPQCKTPSRTAALRMFSQALTLNTRALRDSPENRATQSATSA